jgi:hypothetical protein
LVYIHAKCSPLVGFGSTQINEDRSEPMIDLNDELGHSVALEELITTYCAAWGEPDPGRRAQMLKEVWTEDGTYTDPTAHVAGRRELVEHIGNVLARYPGGRVVRTSVLDTHHDLVRFTWKMVLADGRSLPEGIDFGELSGERKLRRIVGFFGPLAQRLEA